MTEPHDVGCMIPLYGHVTVCENGKLRSLFNAIVDEVWGKLNSSSSSSPPIQPFSPPYPSPSTPPSRYTPPPPTLLGDLARALAAKQRWDPEAEVRIADLDKGGARVSFGQRYEFRLRVERRALGLKFYDEGIEWRKVDGAWLLSLRRI